VETYSNQASVGSQLSTHLTDYSVVQQVDRIIHGAIDIGASDIHIEPYEEMLRVRYRLDGVLKEVVKLAIHQKDAIVSRIKILSNLDISEKRRPQDGRIRIMKEDRDVDLRVSTLPTNFGEKIVLRILDKRAQQISMDDLGFEQHEKDLFLRNVQLPYGMILVTGPTGSGKTTTLYSALQCLNTDQVNVVTIEDPIEYDLVGINQTLVRSDIGLTFSVILRSILRQDPNIVMIGEIRDAETAEIAVRAALTGHLVLSTLHTNDSVSAINRLKDMGIEPYLIAASVRLVLAQRLVRCICKNCKEPYKPESSVKERLGIGQFEGLFWKGTGCEKCAGTGYKGRVGLYELLETDHEISDMIANNAGSSMISQHAAGKGIKLLREAGLKKIMDGITTPEEVIRET